MNSASIVASTWRFVVAYWLSSKERSGRMMLDVGKKLEFKSLKMWLQALAVFFLPVVFRINHLT